MDLKIKDKVALVAASSKGLGFAVAHRLASEQARLAIFARGEKDLKIAADKIALVGKKPFFGTLDLRDAKKLDEYMDSLTKKLGSVDILVVNAGGPVPGGFDDLSDNDWQAGFDLSLMSAIRLVRKVLPGMKKRGWGRILFMVSISVKQPIANLLLSNSIRASVIGMAKTLADEVAKDGITVNCLLPGFINTGRMQQVVKSQANVAGIAYDERLEQIVATIPVGRLGEPEEFADFAAFLVSQKASFITGGSFLADGGMYRGLM